jgi:hypothetical protein
MITELKEPGLESQNIPPDNSENIFGLAVDTDSACSNYKNIHKPGIEKRQRKLLKKISAITPFLHEDEKILKITTGCSPISFFDQILTGFIIFYLRRSIFVFTNKRILHIPTKPDFSYRDSIAQILYSDCREFYIKGSKLIVTYVTGITEKFIYIARRERKEIKKLLPSLPIQAEQSPARQRAHLCPRCTVPLIQRNFTCPGCFLEFKNKAKARIISIIFPGGGYFYTRHPFLGLGDAIVEIYLTVLVLLALAGVLMGVPGSFSAFLFFAVILTIEKAITIHHTNSFINEYIPTQRNITPQKQYPSMSYPIPDYNQSKSEKAVLASWRTL